MKAIKPTDNMTDDLNASLFQYRAAWITEAGHATQGNLTTLESAARQVEFLSKYRDAWLEDEKGNRVSYEEKEPEE